MNHTPYRLVPFFPPPLAAIVPSLFKPGIYHLPDGIDDTGLKYMLQQTGQAAGLPRAVSAASPLVVRHLPQLPAEMQARIYAFDGAILLLSAASARKLSLAHALASFMADSTELPSALHWRLETILHEGISNAIHHGSLQLAPLADEPETASRLADPAYGGRLIALGWTMTASSLDCFIMDQGPGFTPEQSTTPYKGLSLIQSLCQASAYTHGGRCLDFHLSLAA